MDDASPFCRCGWRIGLHDLRQLDACKARFREPLLVEVPLDKQGLPTLTMGTMSIKFVARNTAQ